MPLGLKRNITRLVDHDPAWEKTARETIARLWGIFGPAAEDIQHIGSTSIQGIKAKPIIDIAVAVGDFLRFEPLIPELERNGFTYHGWFLHERDAVLNVYAQPISEEKVTTHHVHVVRAGSEDWRGHIIFRDYLNAHPAIARDYETIKMELAREYPYDEGRQKYGAGKNGFILQTLRDAAEWAKKEAEIAHGPSW